MTHHSDEEGQRCPDCGLLVDTGGLSCVERRDALLVRDYEQPALFGRFHRLAVDAYCLQHESHVASAKSLAAHLCGLCIAFERNNNGEMLRALQRWLSTNPRIVRPAIPVHRGELNIASVYGIDDPRTYGEAVRVWAASVWQAYAALHHLAREWLAQTHGG